MGYLFRIHSVSSDNHDPIIKPMQPALQPYWFGSVFHSPATHPPYRQAFQYYNLAKRLRTRYIDSHKTLHPGGKNLGSFGRYCPVRPFIERATFASQSIPGICGKDRSPMPLIWPMRVCYFVIVIILWRIPALRRTVPCRFMTGENNGFNQKIRMPEMRVDPGSGRRCEKSA